MNIKLDIPESFYEAEERCGYYVSPEMKKVWAVELDLMNEFSELCRKHNLRWYAGFGTLLGAARHKGFIPWDDDVDVIMMRSDYDRFCEIAKTELQEPYCLRIPENNDRILTFAKLINESTTMIEPKQFKKMKIIKNRKTSQGIFIDIFPVDNAPDDDKLLTRQIKRMVFRIHESYGIKYFTKSYYPAENLLLRPLKAAVHYIFKLMNIQYVPYYKKALDEMRAYNNISCRRVGFMTMAFYAMEKKKDFMRHFLDRSNFDETIYMPFEIMDIPVPSGYENILAQYYGNWRKFNIRPHHGTFYDTERPYTYYIEEGHPFQQTKH